MRFYQQQRKFYCGIDLHAKKMYVCVLNAAGEIVLHRNIQASGEALGRVLEPFRDGLVIGVATNLTVGARRFPGTGWPIGAASKTSSSPHRRPALVGARPVHEGDPRRQGQERQNRFRKNRAAGAPSSRWSGGTFPLAYVYPKEMRGTRDRAPTRSGGPDGGRSSCGAARICSRTCRTPTRNTTSPAATAEAATG